MKNLARKLFLFKKSTNGKTELNVFSLVLFLGIVIIWRSPINGSFWLDETISAWVTSSGLYEAAKRAVLSQGQSPLYFSLLWILRQTAGESELIFRSFSLLFSTLTLISFYFIGRRLFDRGTACLSLLALLGSNIFLVQAFSARPYSAALFCCVTSILFLIKWIEDGKTANRIVFIITSLLAIYFHYLFVSLLLVQLVYVFFNIKTTGKVSFRKIVFSYASIGILLLPAFYHIRFLSSRQKEISFALSPDLLDLIKAWLPVNLIVCLVTSVLFALVVWPSSLKFHRSKLKGVLTFLLTWYLLPAVFLFAYSQISGQSIFLERFFMWYLPALALLIGFLINTVTPAKSLIGATAVFFFLILFGEIGRTWHIEDWSLAIQTAKKLAVEQTGIPILVYSGLVELDSITCLNGEVPKDYLLAPLTHYAPGLKGIPIPSSFNTGEKTEYFNRTVKPELDSSSSFILISANKRIVSKDRSKFQVIDKQKEFFSKKGFEVKYEVNAGEVSTFLFTSNHQE